MKRLIIFFIIFATSVMAFAEELPEDTKKLATEMGIIYEGMPREDMFKVFSDLQVKESKESITFSDWMTEKRGDTITFYLVDGKVVGWEK